MFVYARADLLKRAPPLHDPLIYKPSKDIEEEKLPLFVVLESGFQHLMQFVKLICRSKYLFFVQRDTEQSMLIFIALWNKGVTMATIQTIV